MPATAARIVSHVRSESCYTVENEHGIASRGSENAILRAMARQHVNARAAGSGQAGAQLARSTVLKV